MSDAHWASYGTYLEAIERETRRFRECLAEAEPGTRVPSAPDWDVDDLLWHLGGGDVQHFWAWVIANRPEGPEDYPEPVRPEGRRALLAALDRGHEELMLRLRNADPDEGAWSWSADPRLHVVGFTARRQAHEALIHRVDAELAVGDRTPLDPALAADGVVECLEWMYGEHPRWGSYTDDGSRVLLHLSDVGRGVLLGLGRFSGQDPEGGDVDEPDLVVLDPALHDAGHPLDVTITGTAEAVDLWLWGRAGAAVPEVEGDPDVADRLTAVLARPID